MRGLLEALEGDEGVAGDAEELLRSVGGGRVAGDGDVDEGLVPDIGDGFVVRDIGVIGEERAGEDVAEGGAGGARVVGVEFEEADVAWWEGLVFVPSGVLGGGHVGVMFWL